MPKVHCITGWTSSRVEEELLLLLEHVQDHVEVAVGEEDASLYEMMRLNSWTEISVNY